MKSIIGVSLMALLGAGFVLGTLPVCASAAPLTLETARLQVGLKDVWISQDGSKVAYVRSAGDYQHDRWNRTVIVANVKDGTRKAVTPVLHDLSSPQFSPDASRLAYISADRAGNDQVFVMAASGGGATQVTHAAKDVEQYSWSPDGSQFAYVTEDMPADPAAMARHDNLWDVHDDGFLNEYAPLSSHLWLVSSNGGTPRRLTSGSWSVLEALPPFVGAASDPSWSADGRRIAFTMQSDADDSDSDRTMIATVDVATGAVTHLDARTSYEYQPQFAQTGDALQYIYPHGPGPSSVMDVFVARNGTNADATLPLDRDVTYATWLPQNRIAMLTSDGIGDGLYVQQAPSGVATRVQLGELNPFAISASRTGAIAIIASGTTKAQEVYVLDNARAAPRQLSNENAAIDALDLGTSKEITWSAPDGERSDGVLVYPPGFQANKKYPLVLRIHGGPQAASNTEFSALIQMLAGRGYLVFEPNYRGSDNLGNEHEHAIYKDPGKGPGTDVMAGVEAVENLGIVDTTREAVTGHSYGGYMTTWMISQYAGHGWRSAVVGDGAVDWTETYDLSGTGNLAWARDSLGGSPWDPASAEIYRTGSPITYVHEIKVPTLVITGTDDDQVPLSESYELYHALNDMGVTVRFVAIPGAQHNAHDPVHVEGYDRVTLDWVDRYMK